MPYVPATEPALRGWTFEADAFDAEFIALDPEATVLPARADGVVVNGGYFDRARQPKGLVIVRGEVVSGYRADLGGGVVTLENGRFLQHDGETYTVPAAPPRFAVQGYPRLVVGGAVNIARDTGRRAARTVLCVRDEGAVLEVLVIPADEGAGPTLYELAHVLVRRGCEEALNLDGGPSTGARWADGHLPPRGPLPYALALSSADARQPLP